MVIFVYGSLLPGCSNHARYLGDAISRGWARTGPGWALYEVCLAFPAMARCVGAPGVLGCLYEVSQIDLARLDSLEGIEFGHYSRVVVPIVGHPQLDRAAPTCRGPLSSQDASACRMAIGSGISGFSGTRGPSRAMAWLRAEPIENNFLRVHPRRCTP